MATSMSEDQVIAAFIAAARIQKPGCPEGFLTSKEYAQRTGFSMKRVLRVLASLRCSGRLERGLAYEESLAGIMVPVPAYRVLGE